MFERSTDVGTATLAAMLAGLREHASSAADVDDAVRIDRIRLLEEIKSAAAAVQAVETAACRTPYCGAPIRHADHITPAEAGGPTHVHNGRGTCEACNYTNQSPGWHSQVDPGPADRSEVEITTPTGHRYRSRPPDLPGTSRLAS